MQGRVHDLVQAGPTNVKRTCHPTRLDKQIPAMHDGDWRGYIYALMGVYTTHESLVGVWRIQVELAIMESHAIARRKYKYPKQTN